MYRGLEYERIGAFTQRLQTEFPSAQILMKNTPPDDTIINSEGQCILLYCKCHLLSKKNWLILYIVDYLHSIAFLEQFLVIQLMKRFPVATLTLCFSKIHFNIIISFMPMSHRWSFIMRFSKKDFVCISFPQSFYTCEHLRPLHLAIISVLFKLWSSMLCNFNSFVHT